jgi:ribosomal-protein-alanine N-acetyltransferase
VARPRIVTPRLELRPLPAAAAAALPVDRAAASRLVGAILPPSWPQPELLDLLPRQAGASRDAEPYGIWLMVEIATGTVVGDIGFMGRPDALGSVETGYSVVPEHRGLGYASEALAAIARWAAGQPGVHAILARCEAANEGSIHVLRRAGFRPTGTDPDGLVTWRLDA